MISAAPTQGQLTPAEPPFTMTPGMHPTPFEARTSMCTPFRSLIALALGLALAASVQAGGEKKERDIFDLEAQKAAEGTRRIVFIADRDTHGARGNHEFIAAAIYLARMINERYPNAYCVVTTKQNMPKDLKHADAIVVLMNHGGPAATNPAVQEAVARGAGFMAIHYGVEVNKGAQGENYLKWLGGYFEPFFSVNPHWTPTFKEIPDHETTRGVKPFTINDEWYYHMRFVDELKGVTPVLSAIAPPETITKRWNPEKNPKGEGHAGNPDALADVEAGKPQVMAWAYERPDGSRGFGFTGLHFHKNLADDNLRTLLLNATAWVAKLPVPTSGIPSMTLDREALEQLIDDGKLAVKRRGI